MNQIAEQAFSGGLTVANGNEPLTMSSLEIADLVQARHAKVKQSIERLAKRGAIDLRSPMGTVVTEQQLGNGARRTVETKVYQLEKRDSYVVVAQLSPEFTARLVDRWQELEQQAAKPVALSGPQLMAAALIEAQATLDAAKAEIADMREDVEAHRRIAKADGSLSVTEAAKNLGVRPKDLFKWMDAHNWIYKRRGGSNWLGYASHCNNGDLEHKSTTVTRADGSEKITEQVRVTAQGLAKLAKLIPPTASLT